MIKAKRNEPFLMNEEQESHLLAKMYSCDKPWARFTDTPHKCVPATSSIQKHGWGKNDLRCCLEPVFWRENGKDARVVNQTTQKLQILAFYYLNNILRAHSFYLVGVRQCFLPLSVSLCDQVASFFLGSTSVPIHYLSKTFMKLSHTPWILSLCFLQPQGFRIDLKL